MASLEQATAARTELAGALDRACARGPRSAQEAALLTIACLEAGRADAIDPAWRTTMLKSQDFDGGWTGEAFAAAPNRGRSVTWYSSSTLTTALCYDALRSDDLRSPAGPRSGAARNEASPSSVRVLMDDAVRLATLASYVPRSVQRDITDHGTARESAHVEPSHGALLLVDISGFTGLTADAVRRGPAGIEGLSRSLNVQLGAIIDLIAEHGGDIDKIVGDGLLPVWRATDEDLATTARRAASCGLAILAQVGGLALDGDARLPLNIGLCAGEVSAMHVGGVGERWLHLVAGDGPSQLAALEASMRSGALVASPQAWALIADAFSGERARKRLHAGRRRPVSDRAAPGDARGPGRPMTNVASGGMSRLWHSPASMRARAIGLPSCARRRSSSPTSTAPRRRRPTPSNDSSRSPKPPSGSSRASTDG